MRCVSRVLLLVACAAALVAITSPGKLSAQARRRPYRPPPVPRCGGMQPPGVTVPRLNASGDRLYFRLVDSAGYDFEIWCVSHFGSTNYEYRISFPDGTSEEIDTCELFWGSNVIVLQIQGDTITSDTTPNGAPLRRLKGRIRRYYHNNFNSSKDFHTILDYATGKVTRVDTRSATDVNGGKFREITGTSESTIDIPAPPRPAGTPGSSIAPVHGGTVVRSVAPDPAVPYCTAEDSDSLALVERFLAADSAGPVAYHLAAARVDGIRTQGKAVVVSLASDHPGGGVSVVVPRAIGGRDGLARVRVDGVRASSRQSVAGDLRAVTFAAQPGARLVVIDAPRPALRDWRLWLLVSLGLVTAWWIASRRARGTRAMGGPA